MKPFEEKVYEQLAEYNTTLARLTTTVEIHEHRSDLLEQRQDKLEKRLSPLEKLRAQALGIGWFVGVVFAGVLAAHTLGIF